MHQDNLAIRRATQVGFDPVGAALDGEFERLAGILGGQS